MSTKRVCVLGLILAAAALVAFTVPALSFNFNEESARWEVPRQGAPSQQIWRSYSVDDLKGETAPAMAAFAVRHGGAWYCQVNRATGTYHHVYGGSIDLGADLKSAGEVESLARSFIRDNPDIFAVSGDDLSVISCTHALGKWAIIFQQTYHGLRVYGGRVHLVFSEDGRLFEMGSDAHPGISLALSPGLSEATALGLAKIAIGYLEETDKVEFSELMVLPVEVGEDGIEYRLAYRFDLRTVKPYGLWATWVDAASGEILWRENHIRFANFTGHVQGDIDWDGYCDGATADYPVADMTVTVTGVGSANTGAGGDFTVTYSGTGSKTVTAAFVGPWLNVDRASGTNASHSGTITAGTPYTIDWSNINSLASERDVFAYANKVHDWIKALDPTFTALDYVMTCTIERDDYYCPGNAWWDGYGINFCVENASYGYGNTARMGDVVYHEYTHGITQEMYGLSEPPGDVHEGNSDIAAALLTRESIMGLGFYLDECSSGIRDCDNSIQYPCTSDDHYCGQVISGFYWDAWQELLAGYPQAVADSLIRTNWHFGRKMGLPQDMADQVHWAFVADDDDANLGNGTPHYDEFCVGATNHGFDCPEISVGVFITHTPLSDTQNTTNPYPVTAVITSTLGTIVADSCRVTYRVNGGTFASASMTATANPNEYVGYIPARPACSKVQYYIYARDNAGNTKTAPADAPTGLYAFRVGYQTTFTDDFETNKGWTAGVTGDDATTGAWERCDPEGTEAQAEDDHTAAPGVYAYITDCTAGSGQGSYDIDGGKTTLLSPVFDLSDQAGAVVTYYRWYSNDTGAEPGTDYWVVDVTNNNGSTWVNLENTNTSDRSWHKMQFDIDAHVALTNQVRFRFIASDEAPGSLVEAGLDDFSLATCEVAGDTLAPTVSVLDPNGGESLTGGHGAEFAIAWSASDDVGVVTTKILLSTDGGATYPDTLASGALTSPWTWVLPEVDETACRIKVICLDAALNAGSDQSDADFEIISVAGAPVGRPLPDEVVLFQNRPSPFGGQTEIEFGLPGPARISLKVYGVDGRLVATLADGAYPGGYHRALWTGSDGRGAAVSAGMYFYRLETPEKVLTRKTLVVR
jgi:Zn-dependent metalloprotease